MERITWEQTRESLKAIEPLFKSSKPVNVGPYRAFVDPGCGSLIFDAVDRQSILRTIMSCDIFGGFPQRDEFRELSVSDDRAVERLGKDEIEYVDHIDSTYPHFEFRWKVKGSGQGNLDFVRVDLNGSIFINYYPKNQGVYRHGNEQELAQLPRSLSGQTHLLGIEIPWVIDWEEKAQKIHQKSELEKFIQAYQSSQAYR